MVLLLAECDLERGGVDKVEEVVAPEDLSHDESTAHQYPAPTDLGSEMNALFPSGVSRWPAADLPLLRLLGRRLAAIRPIHEVGAATDTREKKAGLLDTRAASEVNENERAKKAGMSLGGRGEKNVVVVGSKNRWMENPEWSGALKYPQHLQ